MLYYILRIPAALAYYIWCRHIIINNKQWLKHKGPLLIAANHPNSFLDAILLCAIFRQPIYSLARGDAFANSFLKKMLTSLKMFPVYRVSEGVENLEDNYKTFEECITVFKKKGVVLIFSEGKCVNEWHLRPLKKGTARLAISAWQQGIDLTVLPLGINYQSFTSFGKNVQLYFGSSIHKKDYLEHQQEPSGNIIQWFNNTLKAQLQLLVVENKPLQQPLLQQTFVVKVSSLKKILLPVPACIGYLLHAPLYIPIQKFAYKKFGKIDHYDSVLISLLFLLYPLYVAIFAVIAANIFCGFWWLVVVLCMPFTAWSYVQIKKQF